LLSDQIESLLEIVEHRLPMGADEACKLGLVERVIESRGEAFVRQVERLAASTIRAPAFAERLEYKNARRQTDESFKPLARYREEELEQMRRNFYGFDPSYHVARYNFVCKVPKSRTPLTIANHRWEIPAWKQVS
jgi:putative two-component system protein, hydrogenase maturation factor HypX/HoxX